MHFIVVLTLLATYSASHSVARRSISLQSSGYKIMEEYASRDIYGYAAVPETQ